MHVISQKALRTFWESHPDAEMPLRRWFKIQTTTEFPDFAAVRNVFPSADIVGDLTVFNIGGNKYRLIASIHFNRQKIYVRHILTHAEYNQGKWKQ